MLYNYNKKLVGVAQNLRHNMTDEEKYLWRNFLKKLPYTVNRQKIIGNFIVDFFIAKNRIVIEIDGSQHQMPENKEKDNKRDLELTMLGITVLRYTNDNIRNDFYAVCEDILKHLNISADMLKNRS